MSTTQRPGAPHLVPVQDDEPENLIGLAGSIRRLLGYFKGYPSQVSFIVVVLLVEMGFLSGSAERSAFVGISIFQVLVIGVAATSPIWARSRSEPSFPSRP